MFIISLISTCTVYTLNIHYNGNDEKPVSKLVQFIFFKIIGRLVLVRKHKLHKI